jgi:hypothetical protein
LTDSLPANLLPGCLTTRQNAQFWNVCPKTLRKMIRQAIVPPPINIPCLGRHLFDLEEQQRAIRAVRSAEVA